MKKLVLLLLMLCVCTNVYAATTVKPATQANTYTDSVTANMVTTDTDQDITGTKTFGNLSSPALIGMPNATAWPALSKGDGLIHYSGDEYLRTTDTVGATVIKKYGTVQGSYFGSTYVTGFDLSDATYTAIYNYLYNEYTPISVYDYAADWLTLTSGGTLYTSTHAIVADTTIGNSFQYTAPTSFSDTIYTYKYEEFLRPTTLDGEATGWVQSITLKLPETAFTITGTEPPTTLIGMEIRDATRGLIFAATYAADGTPDTIDVYSVAPVTGSITGGVELAASFTAGAEYTFTMVCDGTTGIDYYINGVLVGDETDKALPDEADFSNWGATQYGFVVFTGLSADGTISGDLDIRTSNLSFWKAN